MSRGSRPRPTGRHGGDLLVTLPWGAARGEVGLAEPAEGLARGPEALAVAPDGRIAILDSVNKRVLVLGPRPEVRRSTPTLRSPAPRFLAVDDDRIYVLDCDADRHDRHPGLERARSALPSYPPSTTWSPALFATTTVRVWRSPTRTYS